DARADRPEPGCGDAAAAGGGDQPPPPHRVPRRAGPRGAGADPGAGGPDGARDGGGPAGARRERPVPDRGPGEQRAEGDGAAAADQVPRDAGYGADGGPELTAGVLRPVDMCTEPP